MILAVDVQYVNTRAFVAGIGFQNWSSLDPCNEFSSIVDNVLPYVSGSFYKRELPCILALLSEYTIKPNTIVIDGYVFLDSHNKAGLGKYLFDILGASVEIVGVAKKALPEISENHKIYRGNSKIPLYITASGSLDLAKKNISLMCGAFRMPTLLKRADMLCREEARKFKI